MADYKKVISILQTAQKDIAKELQNDHHGLRLDTALTKEINHLSLLTGTASESEPTAKLQPATTIAGEKIQRPEVVKAEDLAPEPTEVDKLKAAVEVVYAGFLNDTNAELLKHDKTVLRGVAKKAGLKDFKEAALNSKYMDKIKAAIKEEAAKNEAKVTEAQTSIHNAQVKLDHLIKEGAAESEIEAAKEELEAAFEILEQLTGAN